MIAYKRFKNGYSIGFDIIITNLCACLKTLVYNMLQFGRWSCSAVIFAMSLVFNCFVFQTCYRSTNVNKHLIVHRYYLSLPVSSSKTLLTTFCSFSHCSFVIGVIVRIFGPCLGPVSVGTGNKWCAKFQNMTMQANWSIIVLFFLKKKVKRPE